MTKQPGRDPLAIGLEWSTRATSLALEFVLPPLVGYAVDRWWGSNPWGVLIGTALGLAAGLTHLARMIRSAPAGGPRGPQPPP